ncbi:MAG: hypothetical protein K0S24_378 [Sphingobacterium sp.]|jgi:hypothetical protein|nr:hypothetical protein [Sphingobacterium sp.]
MKLFFYLLSFLILASCSKDSAKILGDPNIADVIRPSKKAANSALITSYPTKTYKFSFEPFGPNGCIFENQNPLIINNYEVYRTHGAIYKWNREDGPKEQIRLSTYVSDSNAHGSGIAIKFPFQKGKSYKITTAADGSDGAVIPPNFQIQISNSLQVLQGCSESAPPLVLTGNNIIFNSDNYKFNHAPIVINFRPDSCYNYLKIFATSKQPAGEKSYQSLVLKPIIIEETDLMELVVPDSINNGLAYDIAVKYEGFTLNENMNWTASGNIEIVGANYGGAVKIKKKDSLPTMGSITASFLGCGASVTHNFNACSGNQNFVEIYGELMLKKGWKNRVYSYALTNPSFKNLRWHIGSQWVIFSGSEYSEEISVSVSPNFRFNDPINGDYIPISIVGDGPCGRGTKTFNVLITP